MWEVKQGEGSPQATVLTFFSFFCIFYFVAFARCVFIVSWCGTSETSAKSILWLYACPGLLGAGTLAVLQGCGADVWRAALGIKGIQEGGSLITDVTASANIADSARGFLFALGIDTRVKGACNPWVRTQAFALDYHWGSIL